MRGWAEYKPGHIEVLDGSNGYYAMDGLIRNMFIMIWVKTTLQK